MNNLYVSIFISDPSGTYLKVVKAGGEDIEKLNKED